MAVLYIFQPEVDAEAVIRQLQTQLLIEPQSPRPVKHVYLDTFDWRLHDAGFCFCVLQEGRQRIARLRRIETGREVARVPIEGLPVRAQDLPAGVLRTTLAAAMGIRALVRMADARIEERLLEVRNDAGKLVAQIQMRQGHVIPAFGSERPLPMSLECESLRGYQAELQALRSQLDAMPGLTRTEGDFRALALSSASRTPGDYSNKLDFQFDPEQPVHAAMREIIRHLLGIMALNLNGIRQDTDTEFLHDFRVALRRLRSLMRQFADVFPRSEYDNIDAELRWLGGRTGDLRDLDVLLMAIEKYGRKLHPATHQGLEELSAAIKRRRDGARDGLVAALGSARYRRLQDRLTTLVEDRSWPHQGPGLEPLAPRVGDEIKRLHRRILKRGRAIDRDSPPELLHTLRKRGKQLRYVLEMFANLYPPPLRVHIDALKRLQDLLGDYQDCAVYEEELLQILAEDSGRIAPAAALAIGALVQSLERRKLKLRRRFAGRFKQFDDQDNTQHLWRILRGVH